MAPLGVARPYALCVGRIDLSKGVGDLVEHHARYRRAVPDGLDLVLVGGGDAPLPAHPWLHRLGFVDERREARRARRRGGRGACRRPTRACRWCSSRPGRHGRPTLANAASPVLVGQSRRSGGGLWYRDGDEYAAMLDLLARARPLARGDRPPGAALDGGETCGWDRVRAVWLDALALRGRLMGAVP